MALISCFTGPQGLQGMLTCLRDTEGMTGILVVVALLAGWIVVQHLVDARRERRAWESRPGIPVPLAQFGSARHAEAVHAFANREYYQLLLAELEKALTEEGYVLTRDESLRVTMPEVDRQKISRRIFRARQCYTSPRVTEQTMQDSEDAAVNDGYAGTWLSVLIRGNEREGWYISRLMTDWQKQMWPVRQVIINVTSDTSTITRDLVRGLKEAVQMVSRAPFPENDNVISLCTVPVASPDLQVTLLRQLCSTPPGFFPEFAGRNVPEELAKLIAVPQDEEKRVVAVFAQITSPHSTEMLVRYLNAAADRISVGEEQTAEYDDDNGYALIVTRTIKAH
ncbi:hypothetical protein [Enterobacter sp. A103]|uniref:hypothetical protein n=1 Tax=Enterobacter sp. A103 TaxID=3102785 RepID=UPI002ACAD51C|nr:hypothetical protein [Enterobacter sp. A103]MDZ5641604.1 hypothetical protein [Enterobacter sp. A103]